MSTLTTRINGRRVSIGHDKYGIPYVSVEARDRSGYETKRFPGSFSYMRECKAFKEFAEAQTGIIEEEFGWEVYSEALIPSSRLGTPAEDIEISSVDTNACLSVSCRHAGCWN